MESLLLLVPLSVLVVFAVGVIFWRALNGGQFDDLERPGSDLLLDDDRSDGQPEPAAIEPDKRTGA